LSGVAALGKAVAPGEFQAGAEALISASSLQHKTSSQVSRIAKITCHGGDGIRPGAAARHWSRTAIPRILAPFLGVYFAHLSPIK